jgi:hypothetical protein
MLMTVKGDMENMKSGHREHGNERNERTQTRTTQLTGNCVHYKKQVRSGMNKNP